MGLEQLGTYQKVFLMKVYSWQLKEQLGTEVTFSKLTINARWLAQPTLNLHKIFLIYKFREETKDWIAFFFFF